MTDRTDPVGVRVLGAVRFHAADGGYAAPPGIRPARLLAALALAGRDGRSADALADDVWEDEQPRNPRAALQMLVSRIRQAAADGVIESTPAGYRVTSDLASVEAAARGIGSSASSEAAIATASAALVQWSGAIGADLGESALTDEVRARSERTRLALLTARADALLADGRAAEAADDLAALQAANPYDGAIQSKRMRALADAGRTDQAIASFAAFRAALADGLGTDPEPGLIAQHTALLRAGPRTATGLRASPNPLLGRSEDLRRIQARLADARLVTVIGPGGVGKTRVVNEVGRIAQDRFDRVALVELAGARSGQDVPLVIATALGVREVRAAARIGDPPARADTAARVRDALSAGRTLLILDNCEHLIDHVAAEAADLLATVPDLVILTTSRVPLGITGELLAPLRPLPPDAAAADLFVSRAQALRPDARLDPELVHTICERLDGLPLAIELAAARIRTMSLEELDRRLDDRFGLLVGADRTAPERHRTLFAVIEWSHRLLDPAGQRALARLAVFPDGFEAEQATVVVGPSAAAALDELVDQSLLTVAEPRPGLVQFRMLETIREFGLRMLEESGDLEDALDALDAWALAFAVEAGPSLLNRAEGSPLPAIGECEETLLAVLRRPLPGRSDVVIAVLAALAFYWSYRDEHQAVAAQLPTLFEAIRLRRGAAPADPSPTLAALTVATVTAAITAPGPAARATVLLRREVARTSPEVGGFAPTFARIVASAASGADPKHELDTAAESDDPQIAVLGLAIRAQLAENAGFAEAAMLDLRRAHGIAVASGHDWFVSQAGSALAQLHSERGERVDALRFAVSIRSQMDRFGSRSDVRQMDWVIAVNLIGEGRLDEAQTILDDLATAPAIAADTFDDMRVLVDAGLAELATVRGDVSASDRLWARALGTSRASGRMNPWTFMLDAAAIIAATRLHPASDPAVRERTRAWAAAHRVDLLVGTRLRKLLLDVPAFAGGLLGIAAWLRWAGDASTADVAAELEGIAIRLGPRIDMPTLATFVDGRDVLHPDPALLPRAVELLHSPILRAALTA